MTKKTPKRGIPMKCYDAKSLYPSIMVECKYPIAPFQRVENPDKQKFEHEVRMGCNAVIARVAIINLELKDEYEPVPYVSKSKVRNLVGCGSVSRFTRNGTEELKQSPYTGEEDNGRIRACRYCECDITDIDASIMFWGDDAQYKFYDMEVIDMWVSKYDYLPDEIRNYIIELFKAKEEFDGIPEKKDERQRAKIRINSIFGLFLTDMMKDPVVWDEEEDDWKVIHESDKPIALRVDDYYEVCKKTLLVPRIGLFVCCHGRARLQMLIDAIKNDYPGSAADALYCDTDSCFVANPEKHQKAIDALNEKLKAIAIEHGMTATNKNGETLYGGCFYLDKEGSFVAAGAKKYAYEKDGKVTLTLAGVPKAAGSLELQEAGGLAAFQPGMTFHAGKLRPVYHTKDSYGTVEVTDHNGVRGTVEVTSNVKLVDVEYKLGYGKTYGNVLAAAKRGDLEPLHKMLEDAEKDAMIEEYYRVRHIIE